MTNFIGRRGPVTAMAMGGGMTAHLAAIEKLSNGFIVRFETAKKVAVKKKGMETFGFDEETMEVMRLGLQKMKEGESWKEGLEVPGEPKKDGPMERWITVPMAIACKNEEELLVAIRQAVVAHAEIEKLSLSGEFFPE